MFLCVNFHHCRGFRVATLALDANLVMTVCVCVGRGGGGVGVFWATSCSEEPLTTFSVATSSTAFHSNAAGIKIDIAQAHKTPLRQTHHA